MANIQLSGGFTVCPEGRHIFRIYKVDYNKEFGKHMASSVDIAILVGIKRSKAIVEGLKEEKFNDMNIYVVENLDEATKKLGEISKIGDVVLFEND